MLQRYLFLLAFIFILQDLIMIHKHLLICKIPCISFASLVCYGLLLASLGTKFLCLQLCLPSVSLFEILVVCQTYRKHECLLHS